MEALPNGSGIRSSSHEASVRWLEWGMEWGRIHCGVSFFFEGTLIFRRRARWNRLKCAYNGKNEIIFYTYENVRNSTRNRPYHIVLFYNHRDTSRTNLLEMSPSFSLARQEGDFESRSTAKSLKPQLNWRHIKTKYIFKYHYIINSYENHIRLSHLLLVIYTCLSFCYFITLIS